MRSTIPFCIFLVATGLAACSVPSPPTESPKKEHEIGGLTAGEVFNDPAVAALARAGCEGDLTLIEREVAGGADVNTRGYEDATPLLWAINCESPTGVEALLLAGADPNQRFGRATPVLIAAGSDDPAILRLLLKNGGDPDAAYPNSIWSALRISFSLGLEQRGWDNYWALLEAGADVNLRSGGATIAEFAAHLWQYDKVADLLERGYDNDIARLGLAVQSNYPEIMSDEQIAWAGKVKTMLEERGLEFPIPRPGDIKRAERAQDTQK